MNRCIILIAHNIRSCHNVGSLLRTAEGLGVEKVYLTGYTPYPKQKGERRLPHVASRITHKITKTALGAEMTVNWRYKADIADVLLRLKQADYSIYALEQTKKASPLPLLKPGNRLAVVVGNETNGIDQEVLHQCDNHLLIPMYGKKESFNVAQAAAMALYHMRFFNNNDTK